MRFSEYMKPLDENLRSAAIRLLGEDAGRYADLQDEILAGCDHFRSGRLKTLQEFWRKSPYWQKLQKKLRKRNCRLKK